MKTLMLNILFLITCISCSTIHQSSRQKSTQEKPTLNSVEQIDLNSGFQTIRGQFGEPDEKDTYRKNWTVWTYNEQGYGRVIFVFENSTGQLVSKGWIVRPGDLEEKVENTLKRYPQAKFTKREAPWVNPHYGPDEIYYEDDALNLSIEVRELRNEVSAIIWRFANRLPPPKPCRKVPLENGLITCAPDND